jgi:hypothetical protein
LGANAANADNDSTQTAPVLIASALDCEYGVVAFGGQGFVKGIGYAPASAGTPNLGGSWDKYDSGHSRLITGRFSPVPDYIFISEGQNDSTNTLSPSMVTALVDSVRTAAGANCWIFVTGNVSGTGGHSADIATGVSRVASPSKTRYLTPSVLFTPGSKSLYSNDSWSGSSHPNARGQARNAAELIALVTKAAQ